MKKNLCRTYYVVLICFFCVSIYACSKEATKSNENEDNLFEVTLSPSEQEKVALYKS